jgi:hypothetical protein
MQGEERVDRELLDAAALAGHLIPENSMFAFLAGHRAEVFPALLRTSCRVRGEFAADAASPCRHAQDP